MVWCRMVSNGVEWYGDKWCQVSVMTLESLHICYSIMAPDKGRYSVYVLTE